MGTWTLDKTHAEIGFSVRHMMVSKVKGRFRDFDADVQLNPEAPERSAIEVSVEIASIDTGVGDRDNHLRSPDFFDAAQFPKMTFRSKRVEQVNGGQFRVVGDLTIRDVTREVALDGELEGPVPDMQGGRRAGFSLSGEVDREAWGLKWNVPLQAGGWLVGKDVKIAVEAEVVEAVA